MSLQREDCIHAFDTGFIPKISDDRDGIIVTHSSRLISAVSSVRVGEYRIWAVRSLAEAEALKPRAEEAAEYLSWSPHWAHLMRLTLEMGWHDVHRALGTL